MVHYDANRKDLECTIKTANDNKNHIRCNLAVSMFRHIPHRPNFEFFGGSHTNRPFSDQCAVVSFSHYRNTEPYVKHRNLNHCIYMGYSSFTPDPTAIRQRAYRVPCRIWARFTKHLKIYVTVLWQTSNLLNILRLSYRKFEAKMFKNILRWAILAKQILLHLKSLSQVNLTTKLRPS